MNLIARLAAIERSRDRLPGNDAELRERLRPMAIELDLPLDELVDETRRIEALPRDEQEALYRSLGL